MNTRAPVRVDRLANAIVVVAGFAAIAFAVSALFYVLAHAGVIAPDVMHSQPIYQLH